METMSIGIKIKSVCACVLSLSRECLNLSCLPKPSFADMACRVGDMSATCLRYTATLHVG